nr:MAG TPA: hypothetical protein [Caudoviricetes sp.]
MNVSAFVSSVFGDSSIHLSHHITSNQYKSNSVAQCMVNTSCVSLVFR